MQGRWPRESQNVVSEVVGKSLSSNNTSHNSVRDAFHRTEHQKLKHTQVGRDATRMTAAPGPLDLYKPFRQFQQSGTELPEEKAKK
jgi:hypothetical protein